MKISDILTQILKKRGISEDKLDEFLSPPHPSQIKLKEIGVDPHELEKTVALLEKNAASDTPIVVFGDYDADGITATAILWETLHHSGIKSMPFIPHRQKHGYGLSQSGLDEVIKNYHPKLIITVDNGITAFEETRYAQQQGIKIIIVDHHQAVGQKHPADAVIYSDSVAGSGLTWLLADKLKRILKLKSDPEKTLELAAIGTVTDLVPLVGTSRSIVKHGLFNLRASIRPGINALINVSGIAQGSLESYHLGFQLGPRLNAVGRLEHGLDALRLLCTKDRRQATDLATALNRVNQQRQQLTDQMTEMAFSMAKQVKQPALVLWHEEFHEGIIGLVASKLSRAWWRPSVVISKGPELSKASARSIPGFNIIAAIRQVEDLLEGLGGHPMAAGFSLKTDQLETFTEKFVEIAGSALTPEMLTRKLDIDAQLSFNQLTDELATELTKLAPFGIGNPKPLFETQGVSVVAARAVGSEGKHLKLFLNQGEQRFPAIAFGKGGLVDKLQPGAVVDLAYHLEHNTWANRTELQLKVKDIRPKD